MKNIALIALIISTSTFASADKTIIDTDTDKRWVCSAMKIGAQYIRQMDGCVGESHCYKKEKVVKKMLTSYGIDFSEAKANLEANYRTTKLFPSQELNHAYADNICASDSSANIAEIASYAYWYKVEINTIIDCEKYWTPVFDCKQL